MHPRNMTPKNRHNLRVAPAPQMRSQISKTKVMIVDDHRAFRESLNQSLAGNGFEIVAEAKNGKEAIDLAAAVRPEVILMDITMGDIDGVEATRELKARIPETFIVILTMHADQKILTEAIKAGANGYLVKDCSIDEIGSAIEAVVTGETALSPHLAATVLAEVKKFEGKKKSDRVITKREEEVLQLIADGRSTLEVAEDLFISQKTVKNHLASIYQKLNARDRTQAVLQAVRMGIVSLN